MEDLLSWPAVGPLRMGDGLVDSANTTAQLVESSLAQPIDPLPAVGQGSPLHHHGIRSLEVLDHHLLETHHCWTTLGLQLEGHHLQK